MTSANPMLTEAVRQYMTSDPMLTEAVRQYLPWLLSVITIWMTLLAGNKHPNAWLVGLCNQMLWLVWICVAGAWGLLPMNIALWVVYGRNHLKWNHHGPQEKEARQHHRP